MHLYILRLSALIYILKNQENKLAKITICIVICQIGVGDMTKILYHDMKNVISR